MTQKLIQFPAIILQLPFRFAMGAFGCKNWFLGAKKGSVGATPSFRFAIRNYLTSHSFSSLQEIDRLWVLQPNG